MRALTLALPGAVVLALAVLIWWGMPERDIAPAPALAPASAPAIGAPAGGNVEALAAALEEERAARRALAEDVASLRAEVARLSGAAPPAEPLLPTGHPTTTPHGAAPPTFDEKALLEAGFDEREATRLRERVEQIDLEHLYLRDRAVREGWMGTQRFGDEYRALEAKSRGLRDELGDDRYDWLLYASGQSNRVVVQGVMERSPASAAGIRAGDAVLAYDGTRLFDASTLREATTQGRAGETVPVDISRDGERLHLFVPRGPLGVRLQESRLRPAGRDRS